MSSIHKEITVAASPEQVWDAMRDVGALHTRLVPGFVIDCRVEDGARFVTFANGMKAKELIVDVDDRDRRIAWAAPGGRVTHYNASAQVFAEGSGSRIVWIADLLPNEMAPGIAGMIDQGLAAMKKVFG